LTGQVPCVGAAKERGKGTKLFRPAKTTRRNRRTRTKRFIFGRMARHSCCELKGLAEPVGFESSRQQPVDRDIVTCDLAGQYPNESGQS